MLHSPHLEPWSRTPAWELSSCLLTWGYTLSRTPWISGRGATHSRKSQIFAWKDLITCTIQLSYSIYCYPPVMEIRVREYPVDPPTHWAQLGHGALLDAHSAGEVFIAVQETRRAIQGVSEDWLCWLWTLKGQFWRHSPGVIYGWALLGGLVGGAEEDPLLGGGHLAASVGLAVALQLHGQPVELHAELPQVLVLPYALVLGLGGAQDVIHVWKIEDVISWGKNKALGGQEIPWGSFRIVCWMYCWTAKVESISSNDSSGHLL